MPFGSRPILDSFHLFAVPVYWRLYFEDCTSSPQYPHINPPLVNLESRVRGKSGKNQNVIVPTAKLIPAILKSLD